jgi:hypothetical protein
MDTTPIFGLGIPSEDGSDGADLATLLRTLGLDVEDKAGGITAMTSAERAALTGDEKYQGRVVAETDTDLLWRSDGTNWRQLALVDGAWTAYSPTVGGWTIGNGSVSGSRWRQSGKTVNVRCLFTVGSTTTVATGPITLTLPVAAAYAAPAQVHLKDDTGRTYLGHGIAASTTLSIVALTAANVSTQDLSTTNPFTWAAGDYILATVTYEAS